MANLILLILGLITKGSLQRKDLKKKKNFNKCFIILLILLCLLLYVFVVGVFTLSGPQEISVVVGDTAVMSCQYHSFYYDYVKYWCKGYYWNHCTVLIKTNEATNIKGKIQLLDDKHHRTFTLTLKNVKMEDGGWYWCAIERVSKHVKVAVMLTVTTGNVFL